MPPSISQADAHARFDKGRLSSHGSIAAPRQPARVDLRARRVHRRKLAFPAARAGVQRRGVRGWRSRRRRRRGSPSAQGMRARRRVDVRVDVEAADREVAREVHRAASRHVRGVPVQPGGKRSHLPRLPRSRRQRGVLSLFDVGRRRHLLRAAHSIRAERHHSQCRGVRRARDQRRAGDRMWRQSAGPWSMPQGRLRSELPAHRSSLLGGVQRVRGRVQQVGVQELPLRFGVSCATTRRARGGVREWANATRGRHRRREILLRPPVTPR